jgi:hypothetical protein
MSIEIPDFEYHSGVMSGNVATEREMGTDGGSTQVAGGALCCMTAKPATSVCAVTTLLIVVF